MWELGIGVWVFRSRPGWKDSYCRGTWAGALKNYRPPCLQGLTSTHLDVVCLIFKIRLDPPTLLAGYRACEMEFVLSRCDHWVEAKTATVVSTVVSPIPRVTGKNGGNWELGFRYVGIGKWGLGMQVTTLVGKHPLCLQDML